MPSKSPKLADLIAEALKVPGAADDISVFLEALRAVAARYGAAPKKPSKGKSDVSSLSRPARGLAHALSALEIGRIFAAESGGYDKAETARLASAYLQSGGTAREPTPSQLDVFRAALQTVYPDPARREKAAVAAARASLARDDCRAFARAARNVAIARARKTQGGTKG